MQSEVLLLSNSVEPARPSRATWYVPVLGTTIVMLKEDRANLKKTSPVDASTPTVGSSLGANGARATFDHGGAAGGASGGGSGGSGESGGIGTAGGVGAAGGGATGSGGGELQQLRNTPSALGQQSPESCPHAACNWQEEVQDATGRDGDGLGRAGGGEGGSEGGGGGGAFGGAGGSDGGGGGTCGMSAGAAGG